ncbi:hypothetical protein K458DRAFT_423220 [Lentithecium fluviatile CBS 122367]|uniref:Uncharacterized protein n=1 Tax=Lentithecium fluviatile CBS 122367 TaxID=1168545 RepID=A0A6G1IJX0_9PLEO|nr:hypothetical protein K458DRAFT_423220 [Lentithecium fluviatile CBS 122367]
MRGLVAFFAASMALFVAAAPLPRTETQRDVVSGGYVTGSAQRDALTDALERRMLVDGTPGPVGSDRERRTTKTVSGRQVTDDGTNNSSGFKARQSTNDGFGFKPRQSTNDGSGFKARQSTNDGSGFKARQSTNDGSGFKERQSTNDGSGSKARQSTNDGSGFKARQSTNDGSGFKAL